MPQEPAGFESSPGEATDDPEHAATTMDVLAELLKVLGDHANRIARLEAELGVDRGRAREG